MELINLSKIVSQALRHTPEVYGLKLDSQGWVFLSELLAALNQHGFEVNENDILRMIETGDKKRHQLLGNKIRAYYGHSTQDKIEKTTSKPPKILYHGTNDENLKLILVEGISPMSRQYVHLSVNESTAGIVGSRKKGKLVILEIMAQKAYADGIEFYKEENDVWLSTKIDTQYINIKDGTAGN